MGKKWLCIHMDIHVLSIHSYMVVKGSCFGSFLEASSFLLSSEIAASQLSFFFSRLPPFLSSYVLPPTFETLPLHFGIE